MIPKLQSNERFITDFKQYQKRIAAVSSEPLQKELTEALIKFRDSVQYLDRSHEQVFITGKIPGEVSEIRSNVTKYKRILDQKLAHWESLNPAA